MLEEYIRQRLTEKEILLMTHIVIGYPTLEDSFDIVRSMVAGGVDLMELQIPFSEPIADGPVILAANQKSLAGGISVSACVDFAGEMARTFDIPFFFMSYFNILYKYGVDRFVATMAEKQLKGAIVPDLPPEEGRDYLQSMDRHNLSPIMLFSPTTSKKRMDYIASHARWLIYCVDRKVVTGQATRFSEELDSYLAQCRQATDLPLALGFGVKDKSDIDFLKGKVDIAVIGTRTIRLVDSDGVGAVEGFIRSLR